MKSVKSKTIVMAGLALVLGLCVVHTARTQEAATTESASAATGTSTRSTASSTPVDQVQTGSGATIGGASGFVFSGEDHPSAHPGVSLSADSAFKATEPAGHLIVQHFEHKPHALNVWKTKGDVWKTKGDWTTENSELQNAIQQNSAAIRDAANDEQKAAASTELREVLAQHFEEDLKHRQQELEKIAERLEKLRSQLARRREKKDEIVDLQLKVVVNEAEGLGFYRVPSGPEPFDQMITPPAVPVGPMKLNLRAEPVVPARVK